MSASRITRVALASFGSSCKGFLQQPRKLVFSNRAFGFSASRMFSTSGSKEISYTASESGTEGTNDYRISFTDVEGKTISPWHDVPLENGNYHNFICEIPRYTKAKMEIAKHLENNPIIQDTKDGKLRYYDGPMFWNYGYLPQTWENPYITNEVINFRGDNDPLDVVEIGSSTLGTGSVSTVKVLGALAMIDCGELDWKIIAIDVNDRMAAQYEDITDVEDHIISGIREWFRWYKTPMGKPLNTFEYNEMCMPKAFANEVIMDTHEHWLDLVQPDPGQEIRTEDKIWTGNGFTR